MALGSSVLMSRFKRTMQAGPKEVWMLTTELTGERAGSFRQERWSRALLTRGFIVKVFELRGALRIQEFQFDSVEQFIKFRQDKRNKKVTSSLREGAFAKLLRKLKHHFIVDLYFPNVIFLVFRLLFLLTIRKRNVWIMASSPPFSLALAGAIAKTICQRKACFVVDMRDAWAKHPGIAPSSRIRQKVEKFVLSTADLIATVSNGLAGEFRVSANVEVATVYNVAAHFDNSSNPVHGIKEPALIDRSRIQITFTGSLPPGHFDVETFANALKIARQRDSTKVDGMQFVFAGACSELEPWLDQKNIEAKDAVFLGHVSHDLAKILQARSDILLFFAFKGKGNHGVVSTKLFEYIASNTPILPLSVCEHGDVDFLLKHICGQSLRLHTVSEFADAILDICSHRGVRLPRLTNQAALHSLHQAYDEFLTTIESVQSSYRST